MFTTRDIIWSLAMPAAISLVITMLGWRPWTARNNPAGGWSAAAAIGIAFVTGFYGLKDWDFGTFPPGQATDWLPLIALVVTLLGIADGFVRIPKFIRAMAVFLIAAVAMSLFLKFKFQTWTVIEAALSIGCLAVLAMLWWGVIEDSTEGSPLPILLIGLSCACIGVVLMLIGSLAYGKFSLILGAAAAGMLPAVIWRAGNASLNGAAIIFSIMLVLLLAAGVNLFELKMSLVLIIASTPLFIWVGRWLPTRLKPWHRIAIRLLITAIPLGTAVTMAAIQFHQNDIENSY